MKARDPGEMFNRRIDLQPGPDSSPWAVGSIQPGAMLQAVGNSGSGGRI